MKDIRTIIKTHFYENPRYYKVSQATQCQEIISFMPESQRDLIAFCYFRQNTFFIALKHPIGLSELKRDSSIYTIKNILKNHAKSRKDSIFNDAKDIKLFVTNITLAQKNTTQIVKKFTPLQSNGTFINLAKVQEVYDKFEQLRQIIIQKRI